MICKVCGSEFNIENFDVCPYCLTPIENSSFETTVCENPIIERIENDSENAEILDSNSVEESITYEDYVVTEDDLLEEEEEEEAEEVLIDEIGLSVRAVNAFRRARINTLNELIEFLATNSVSDLKNVGAKTVKETEDLMEKLRLGDIDSIRVKTDSTQIASEGPMFKNISVDVDYLNIVALIELGLPNKAVSNLIGHGIRCCGELRVLKKQDFVNILGRRYMDKLPDIEKALEKDIITLLNEVLDGTRYSREYKFFLRRAQGETLQEIANNPMDEDNDKITRERVRQIERSYLKTVQPFVKELFYILKGGKKYVLVQDLLEIFDDDEYDQVLLHACKSFNEFEYLDFADLFIEKQNTGSVELFVMNLLSEVVGDGIDFNENKEEVESVLVENKLDYISLEAVKNLLIKNGYYIYGDFIVRGKANYSTVCMYVVRKYYPDGIKLSQSACEQTEDLIRLRKIIDEKYHGVNVPASDRSLSSTLVRNGLVLRGRGQYISQEYINLDESLLAEIKKYIDDRENNKVFYNEIYATFEGALNVLCGIDNYNYLHGVLALRYPDLYEYGRDYLLKNGIENSQAESIADRIYDYICRLGRPISKTELFQEFRGFSNIMLTMPFVNDKRLMQWEYNYFTCSGIQSIDEKDIVDLRLFINDIFDKNKGYASDGLLLERVSDNRPDFIEKNQIKTEMNLHYLIANLFGDEMDFKRPHIGRKGRIDLSSTKNVALYLLGNPDYFTFDQYNEMVDYFKWSRVTASAVLSDIEENYVRLSVDQYCKKNILCVPEKIVTFVKNKIDENMAEGIMPLMNAELDDFPEWEYSWNEFILETVIKECIPNMDVIHPIMKDRRYQRGIVVEKERMMNCYSQVVASKMKSIGYDAMTESQFLSFLVVHNLAKKAIPSELANSDYIRKDGELYKVVSE